MDSFFFSVIQLVIALSAHYQYITISKAECITRLYHISG